MAFGAELHLTQNSFGSLNTMSLLRLDVTLLDNNILVCHTISDLLQKELIIFYMCVTTVSFCNTSERKSFSISSRIGLHPSQCINCTLFKVSPMIIISKAYRMLGLLRRSFSTNITAISKKHLYISLVRSQLMFCSTLWKPYISIKRYQTIRTASALCNKVHIE